MKKFTLLFFSFFCLSVYAQQWDWAKGGGGTTYDKANSLSTDTAGNVFVTGSFRSPIITFGTTILTNTNTSGNTDDIFIAKYDANGNVLWAKRAGGVGRGSSVSADAGGNVFVTGESNGNVFISKYDANGNVLWAKSASGTNECAGFSVSADPSGNVFVTGFFSGSTIIFGTTTLTNSVGYNVFLAKYDANGNLLWAKSPSETYYNYGNSVTADASGNVIVTGQFNGPSITFGTSTLSNATAGTDDLFIAKYDAQGNVLWANRAGGGSYDVGYSISADKFGNTFVTGSFYSATITFGSITLTNPNTNGYNKQFFIAKYDANGNALWAKSKVGTSEDAGYSVCTDEIGNAFVTGYFSPSYSTIIFDSITLTAPQGNCNYGCLPFFIVKYDANGNVLCASALSSSDFNTAVSTDRFGNAYVGGEFHSNPFIIGTDTLPLTGVGNIFVAKYTCNNNTVATNELSNEESISVFPNPSSGIFTINLKNKTVAIKICVYDVMGNCLLNKDCHGEGSPTIDLSGLPKEIYFMKIVFDGKSVMKKIVMQ